MLKPNENFEKFARAERLVEARQAAGYSSAEKAAARFSWNVNTYKAHESGRNGFGIAIAKRYAQAFGVTTAWLQTGEGSGPQSDQPASGLVLSSAPIGMIPVTGKVAANSWLSVEDMDFGYDDIDYVPSTGTYPIEWQFALSIEGNCLNKIAQHGERLVCLNIIAAHVDIEDGDLAIVERRRYGGQMVERTAKRVRKAADGYELWPESTDPAHQEPIRLYRAADGEDIQVIGKVLWIIRKP
ncbi:LexA family transcriptional regulator [Rhizobium sp. CSW-27]|uniref:LexA family transcriptional regulator n=1 Tax=Rhizobium sp. CSW-27 TaxID=2839985 RepID=UPI001C0175A6|nr:LexA family transcriptional regulator [Rhizobium sp. CSW-27]MBT9370301.1 XRE family transcriptional regulator [Rhizobium sp. CSW-27]